MSSFFKKVGAIKSNALGYDARFEINYFLKDGTELFVRDDSGSARNDVRPEPVQAKPPEYDRWISCVEKLPAHRDCDPWGNIFVIQGIKEPPVMINLNDLLAELATLKDKNMANLPRDKKFVWKPTGLTKPRINGAGL